MTERLSTGMRNFLLGEGSMRKAFEDCVMKIYSGAAPASADDAATGVLLVTITKASGDVSSGERSTPQVYTITMDDATPDVGEKVKLLIDTVAYEFTVTASESTNYLLAIAVARWLNDFANIDAIALDDSAVVYVKGRIDGEALAIADNTSTTEITVADKISAARSDSIYFAKPSSGAMSKASETWSGEVQVSGVAGYFRFVKTDDDGTYSVTQVRAQGGISTSGSELDMSNLSLVDGETHTVDSYSISLPAE